MKKKKNAILKSQIEQYEKLLSEVTKEEEDADKKNNSNNDSANDMRMTNKSGMNMSKNQSTFFNNFCFFNKVRKYTQYKK